MRDLVIGILQATSVVTVYFVYILFKEIQIVNIYLVSLLEN